MTSLMMSESQKLIYLGQMLTPDAPLYNMAWRFDLHLDLDVARFVEAFEAVMLRHDALSTRITNHAGHPLQERLTRLAPFRDPIDFSQEEDAETAAQAWMTAQAAAPLDLAKQTFDTALLKLGEDHWVWFFVQHHIATDAQSGALVFQAVGEAYRDELSQGDLAQNESESFQTFLANAHPDASAQAHWAEKAAAISEQAAPFGISRRMDHTRSVRLKVDFGAERSAQIAALTQDPRFRSLSPDLSRFAIFASLFAGYLARLTGADQVSFGAPAHNRATPALKATPGLFIELFPISLDVPEEATFESLFRDALTEALSFLRHAKPQSTTSASARAFNAVLNVMQVDYGMFAGAPARTTWLHPGAHDARHDLRLNVYDFNQSGTLTVEFDLNTHVFSNAARARVAAEFLALVDGFLADPSQPLHHVPLAAHEPEAGRALGAPHDPAPLLLDQIARLAEARPDEPAVTGPDASLTYAELHQRSLAYAHALRAQGVEPGNAVIVQAKRSSELLAAILGVMKAGAFFIPLAADTPQKRFETIKAQSGAKSVISDGPNATLRLGELSESPRLNAADLPTLSPDQTAYAIFTSGSTGEPKGVAVSHQAIADYVDWAARSYSQSDTDRYAFFSAIGFDLTLTSIFAPLVRGGEVVVYPETPGTDLAVLDVFADDAVDVVKLTPAHLALVCEAGQPVSRIKTLILGGDNLTTSLCKAAQNTFGADLRIFNEYGPTEAIVGCMLHAFDPVSDQGASVPIGRPADGVEIYVLDKGGNPCPTGVIGEIHVGGGRLASGYLGRSDLTQSAFQPNPFGTGRLYKTGDLARISETGVITYLGRQDDQVKVGGVRVELAEVAAVIEQQSGVTQAHVIALETSAETVMDTTLVAYAAGAADGQALRSHLRNALPLAMVPSEIILVEALPLTVNGKVDTKTLPAPTGGSPLQTAEAAPPETPQEMALVALFESILDARPIGVTDNFYDMGGDSIAAIQIAIRAEEQGFSLAPNAIFEHQTIRELAATVAHAAEASAPTEEEDDTALLDLGDDDRAALAAQMERLS